MSVNIANLHQEIFQWWRQQGRLLPWRKKEKSGVSGDAEFLDDKFSDASTLREAAFTTYFAHSTRRDPYKVVVAEMMLQQTQVDRVLPKYEAWMKHWPQIDDLAKSSLAEVLIFWQGLGYNRRAKFLWLLAKEISENRAGFWPTSEKELMALPGIGKYTARAIQSFALGQHVGVVDTNVKRVLGRILGMGSGVGEEKVSPNEKKYFQVADEILPAGQADPWNQALMDFGALICTARNPKCEVCPVQELCSANFQAKKLGFANFAAALANAAELANAPELARKLKIKFQDTDRFFRGRIIDELRQQSHTLKQLQKILEERYGLIDQTRFDRLLRSLEKEGLVRITEKKVSLG